MRGDAGEVALVTRGSVATRAAGWGAGRGGRACPLSDQQARPASGAPVAGGCAVDAGAGGSARWRHPPRGWRPRAGSVTTVGGRRRAYRPGGRTRRGYWRCRRGMACGPSAAQAGSERAWLGAGSAVACDDGWWACQDLNLGPHPYQQSRAYRYATLRFCRSRVTVGGEVMRSSRRALIRPTRSS
jgi:hypothetical protein